MTNAQSSHLPFYVKWAQVIMGLATLFYVIHLGREVLAPLVFALYFSILLNPVANFIHRKGIPRVIAILLTLILGIALLCGLVFFIGSQVVQFRDSLPEIKQKFSEIFKDLIDWFSHTFNVGIENIHERVDNLKENGIQSNPQQIGKTLGNITGFIVSLVLTPVYMFMLLFYKPLLLDFIRRAFPDSSRDTVAMVLAQTKTMIQSYLMGLLIEACIVATIDSVGLMIIGIEHALLFGVLAAFLNLIPYVGGLMAMSLPAAMALTSDQPTDAFFVIGLFAFVQLLDNNFIIPKIVASKVKLNALVSIVAVVMGGALWGVPGMFLALPTTAIIKVICDHIESMKPIGFLLGDTMPPIGKIIFKFKTPQEEKKTASSAKKADTSLKKPKRRNKS